MRSDCWGRAAVGGGMPGDRKSTRLNSSHSQISYAVFCLKKKKKLHTKHHPLLVNLLFDYAMSTVFAPFSRLRSYLFCIYDRDISESPHGDMPRVHMPDRS